MSGYSVYRSINPAEVAETKTDAELAPYLLANTVASDYRDAGLPGEGQAYCYTTRARSGAVNGCP